MGIYSKYVIYVNKLNKWWQCHKGYEGEITNTLLQSTSTACEAALCYFKINFVKKLKSTLQNPGQQLQVVK